MDVVKWVKFGNSGICMREDIITSVKTIFEGLVLIFDDLGLALGMALKFHNSLAKGLELKVRKLWGLNLTFGEVIGQKLIGVPFCPSFSWIGLGLLLNEQTTFHVFVFWEFMMF